MNIPSRYPIFDQIRARGYSVIRLSKILGVDRVTLYRWAQGHGRAGYLTLESIAAGQWDGRVGVANPELWSPVCVACGSDVNLECHHKIPKAKGGTDDPQNLVMLCRHCHRIVVHGTAFQMLAELRAMTQSP